MIVETWSAPVFHFSEQNIALWNAAMTYAGQTIPLGTGAGLSFTLRQTPPDAASVRKVFLGENRHAYVRIDTFPFQSYCDLDLELADLTDMPPDLADALNDGMLMTGLSALPEDLTAKLRLGPSVGMTTLLGHAEAADLQWFSCNIFMTNEDAIELTLGAKPDDLCAELCRYAPSTGHMHTLLGDHILVTAERLTGTALLTVAELRGLEPGDCILFSQAATEGQWAILAENHVFIFEAGENGWVCGPVRSFNSLTDNKKSGAPMTNDGNLPLPAEGSGQDDEALAVGPLEISVTFSLGSTRLPISEIESWQSGAVVALPEEISASDTKVTVNANGLPVAQGDLVRIDDRLAVRLNRILLSPSRQDG